MTARTPKRAAQLGVSDDEYASRLKAQRGHCALCPNEPKTRRLHVDHDHRTGRVRGLLCYSCNRRLWAGSTADWLIRAALYVDPAGEDETARARAYAYAVRPVTHPQSGVATAPPWDAPREGL